MRKEQVNMERCRKKTRECKICSRLNSRPHPKIKAHGLCLSCYSKLLYQIKRGHHPGWDEAIERNAAGLKLPRGWLVKYENDARAGLKPRDVARATGLMSKRMKKMKNEIREMENFMWASAKIKNEK